MKKRKINKKKDTSRRPSKKSEEKLLIGDEMIGVIDIARSGDAYVKVEGKNKDLFIHRKNTFKAFVS